MEFNLLYLKYIFIVQSFCVSLETIDGTTKFVRKNQPVTFECPFAKQDIEKWKVGFQNSNKSTGWLPIKTTEFEANVLSVKVLNITLILNHEVKVACESSSTQMNFKVVPIFNDNKENLHPSSETPYAIKDAKFTLECKASHNTRTWYTGNGTVIAKYIGNINNKDPKYFGSRQETSCQSETCTLSITSISLDEDNMSIICSTGDHGSMFNITVFVLPKSVTIKNIFDTVPMAKQNKSYECLIKDTNPEFSVFWLITKKDGTQKNTTKYISNNSSISEKLTTLSSVLTLTLNKNFEKLQCVAYYPGIKEFVNSSKELDLQIKYSPEKDDMTLNISGGKVCVDTPTNFQCSWKGGNPPASVTLMYKNISKTSKEEVELHVTPSKSHQTVKCLGTHIAANASREKNLTIYYPPEKVEIETDEPFLEGHKGILHCKPINGYPEIYNYRWAPNNSTSQNLTFPQLNRTQNNQIFTCYASNKCNKEKELHKTNWINVEYVPDITAPENMTLIENQASIINCSAKGNPMPQVTLEYRNQNFPSNSPLTFNRRNISDVSCVAIAKSTKHGNLTSRKKINILLKYPPRINIEISSETNNDLIISCTAFDGNPAKYEYKLKQKWGNSIKNTYSENVLSLENSFNNTGTWVCHVSNGDFHVNKSANYTISVKPILSSTSNSPKKRNASNGETVTFKQCFYSHPKSNVRWQKNGELIDSNKYSTNDEDLSNEFPFKASCTSLKIEDIKDDDFGTYTLTVENSLDKIVITFTLRSKETTEMPLALIIGCTVGIFLFIIIMGLVVYKLHKRRAIKKNNEFSSTKAINTIDGRDFEHPNSEGVHEVTNAIYDSSDLNAEDIYANVPNNAKVNNANKKTNDVNELYAKVNKPSKPANDVNELYAKVNKPSKPANDKTKKKKPADDKSDQKPADVEELYAKVNKPSKKTPDVEELYAKVNKPSKKTPDDKSDKKPADVEELYAKVNKPSKKTPDDKSDKKPADVEELYAKVNKPSKKTDDKTKKKKPADVNDLYAQVNKTGKTPEEMEDGTLNDNYKSNNQSNEPESVEECNYAELEFINNPGTRRPAPTAQEDETIYAELIKC